jgi:hypothetical protein
MKRNPQFFVRRTKPLAAVRKNAHNVQDFVTYFEEFHNTMENFGLTPSDVWNMNETGFRIGCGASRLVATLSLSKKIVITDPDNDDYITATECINAAGDNIPSFLTLKEVNILNKWTLENDLDDDIVLSTSDTGYSNDSLAFE